MPSREGRGQGVGADVGVAVDAGVTGVDAGVARVPPLLVLAVGNPSRGDDALGPAVLEALRAADVEATGDVELLTDFQLQVEHALDLQGRAAVLFVDAARPGAVSGLQGAVTPASGVALTRLAPAMALPALSHALAPGSVLHVAAQLGQPVPPAWQLAVQGEAFELGEGLSEPARVRLADAVEQALGWLSGHRP